ncbi:hypothetical protein SKAU_G00229950 [Synaphobranchus kaupii]|uniref:Uncharacterized protein n=1 Tax=Synaphobranchus kaupii TaxID=118154 RepID=A0A9Q1IT62_SYNKA|nr:hypothetical protein SKAU_G00229950 [Synaphobranchus kaupii]
MSPFKSSDEGNYTCETVFMDGSETVHFIVKAESNVNALEAQRHPASTPEAVIWSMCGFIALLTLTVLSSVIIRRKLRKKPGTSERFMFPAEEIQDIEPYITYTEKTNAIYDY